MLRPYAIVFIYLCVFARDNLTFGCGVAALRPFVVSSLSNHVVKSAKTVPFDDLRLNGIGKEELDALHERVCVLYGAVSEVKDCKESKSWPCEGVYTLRSQIPETSLNDLTVAPVLTAGKKSRRKAMELLERLKHLERLERASVLN